MTCERTYTLMLEFLEEYANGLLDLTMGEVLGALALDADGVSMDARGFELWKRLYEKHARDETHLTG